MCKKAGAKDWPDMAFAPGVTTQNKPTKPRPPAPFRTKNGLWLQPDCGTSPNFFTPAADAVACRAGRRPRQWVKINYSLPSHLYAK
jgi:hypothetical protein